MVKKHETSKTISSEKKDTAKSKIGQTLILVLVALIVAGTIFGIYMSIAKDTQEKKTDFGEYNGFEFVQVGNYWQTQLERNGQLFEAPFYFHPQELDEEIILFDQRVTQYILQTPHEQFTIAIHPEAGSIPVLAGVNLARIMGKYFGVPTRSAFYVPQNESFDFNNSIDAPVVSCENATQLHPIFYITPTYDESVVEFSSDNPHCIIIGSQPSTKDNMEILKPTDYLSYRLLHIIQE